MTPTIKVTFPCHTLIGTPGEAIPGPAGPPGAPGSPGAAGSADTAAQILAKLVTVDGPGSGLDADTLDGQSAAAFEAAGAATSAVATHAALVSGVHGITVAAATVLDETTIGAMVDTLGGASSTGTGGLVRATGPTITLANATGLPVAGGGTGLATLTANNVILGNGTSAPTFVAPNSSGNVLTSNGTTWTSAAPTGGGNVSNTGTPVNDQVAIWTSATVVEGSSNLTFNGTTLTAAGFAGPLTGNVTGNASGSSGSTTGNAATATALATGRTITITGDLGYTSPSFDGSGNVTAAGTIANDAVTYAKMQNVSAASKLIGRGSAAGAGDAEEITVGSGLAMTGTTLSASGGGDFVGPASATDNAVIRFDGTTGKLGQNSSVTIDDLGNLTVNDLTAANLNLGSALGVAAGGTGLTTLTANNVILGNGTSAPGFVAPSTSGNLLTSNGTTWTSAAAPAAATITVANEATDTTCFPVFATAATGSLGPKTNASLTFNSSTASLGCTTFVGALTGNASTASAVAVGGITGLGTGVATALAVNVGSAGAPVVLGGAGGTPSSLTLTNGTGLPVSTGVSGLGTGIATALAVNVGSAGAPVVLNGALGTPSSGTLTNCTADGTNLLGYRGVPQNSQSAAYTTVLADAGKCIFHPVGDNNARTFTIDSNANVAYPIGTMIEFLNMAATASTIAITSDTLTLLPAGTTGSRTLAQYGKAVAEKITSTAWVITGNSGLT